MLQGDDLLAYQVIKAIYASNRFSHAVIDVKESEGTVTLIGMVEDFEDREIVEARVRELDGVIEVVNQLHVIDFR